MHSGAFGGRANVRYPAALPWPSGADSAYLPRMLSQLKRSVGGGVAHAFCATPKLAAAPPPLRLRLRATQEN